VPPSCAARASSPATFSGSDVPRQAAWNVLRSGTETPLRAVDREADRRSLEPRDRALLRRILGTEVRRRGTLRAIVRAFAHGKLSQDLAAHLRLGFAQIFFLDRVPPHAAVSETVRATSDTVGLSKGRTVNAILRAALRARRSGTSGDPTRDIVGRDWTFESPVFRDPREHPLLWAEDALSMPSALIKRWTKRFGEERAFELGRTYLEEPDLSVRVARGERAAARAELEALELAPRDSAHPQVLILDADATETLLSSAPFEEGRLTVQGETALAAAELLRTEAGERVLDLCAAPGGKTAVLAASGATVVAADRSPSRLARLAPGLRRLGLAQNVQPVASLNCAAFPRAVFDAVLVDAPCSNTGVLGARPGARWRFGPSAMRSLAAVQTELLAAGAARTRPGGRLVWSTCSLEPEENERRVRAFLTEHADWSLAAECSALPAQPGGTGPIDGGYAALIVRAG